MPLYTFMNKDTDEVFTEMMSISQREEYLSQNPNITQQIVKVNMISGTGIKNDGGWNENLSRIAEAHPNSALADKLGGRTTKHAKSMSTLEKHGVRKGTYSNIKEKPLSAND
tara:strand:- start:69 stop:404 length:336 start_codon:yes stop_codon:yes gene_type:complete